MNELEQQSPLNGELNREAAAQPEAETIEKKVEDEVAPASADVCVEEESPALSIAEVADEAESEADGKTQTVRNFHAMSREQLLDALKEIVESGNLEAHKEVAAIKQAYYSVVNKDAMNELAAFVEAGNPAESFSATPDVHDAEVKELLAAFREKRAAYLEKKEEEKKENLDKKNEIIASLKAIVEDIDNINLRFPDFQKLQQSFKEVGDVPAGAETEVWKNYQTVVEQFYDRLKMNKELRDLDFKKNLEIKQALVQKAKDLTELADPIEAFRKLQDLHLQWREVGPVAKEIREEIWNEFKELSTAINKRHQDYFETRKADEAANEAKKEELCAKIEAINIDELKTFADWDAKTKEIIELQKEYKEAGFAPKKSNTALFTRFRKACDDFFSAKAEYFKKTKDELRENLAKKEALCEKAEALLDKAQEKGALDQMQALQAEWKTVGVVRRKAGDEVWKRFCAAVDAFHSARRKHFGAQRSAENDNLKAKQEIINQLKAISEESDRKDVIATIRELQDKWQEIGFVPFKQKEAVNTEYRNELSRLFSAFDMRESRQRMRRFEGEVKKMDGDENKIGRERDRLVRAIESRQAELKTIENNLGFFNVKSSAGNSMLKDFEKKIQRIKDDIAQIQEKIKLLDSQDKA